MSCPSKDNFEQTLQIADFAVQRLENRRQYEFKIFISYVTLLVLAIYKHDLLKPSLWGEFIGLVCGLCFIHTLYISWTIRLSVANRNDSKRRDFYLRKTECISVRLLKGFGDPLCRKMESEYCLPNQEEQKIEKVPRPFEAFKHIKHLWINYAATFQFGLSTILSFLLVYVCCKELCKELYVVWRLAVMLTPLLPFLVISIFMCCRRKWGAK